MPTDRIELVNVLAAAHCEIQRLKAENERLRAERDAARTNAENWMNEVVTNGEMEAKAMAEIGEQWIDACAENECLRERLQIDPGGSDKIDELEQALQFVRHELEVTRDERDEAVAEISRLKDVLQHEDRDELFEELSVILDPDNARLWNLLELPRIEKTLEWVVSAVKALQPKEG